MTCEEFHARMKGRDLASDTSAERAVLKQHCVECRKCQNEMNFIAALFQHMNPGKSAEADEMRLNDLLDPEYREVAGL